MTCRSNVATIHLPNPVHKRQPLHSGMCLANVEVGAVKGLLSPLPIKVTRVSPGKQLCFNFFKDT